MTKKSIRPTEGEFKNIVSKSIKKVINEINKGSHEPLLEMARVDEPHKDSNILGTKEVWVYGDDRSSMSPHFHYFDRRNNPFEVEVNITDLTICKSKPRNGVSRNQLKTWKGIEDAKKALDIWLNSPNADIPSQTNYQMLKVAWNQNNRNNPVS